MNNQVINNEVLESLSEIGYNGEPVLFEILNWFITDKGLIPEILLWSQTKNEWYFRITSNYGHIFRDFSNNKYSYNDVYKNCILYMIKLSKK